MDTNPLDELLTPKETSKPEIKKDNNIIKIIKGNPIFKELTGPLIFIVILFIIIVFVYFYLFDPTKETYYKNAVKAKEEAEQLLKESESTITSLSTLEYENKNLQLMISEKKSELEDANMVRTPLEQGFYFIAYFDSLVKSLDIDLIKMEVVANNNNSGEQFDLMEQQNMDMGGNYDLLPVYVEFETTFDNLNQLFDKFYTKRIVYDNNLTIENRFDGTVYVTMIVTFEGGLINESNGNVQQEQGYIEDPTAGITQDENIDSGETYEQQQQEQGSIQ